MSSQFDRYDGPTTTAPDGRAPSNDAAGPPPKRSSAAVRRLVILGMIAVVAVPLAIAELPREVAKWYAAAAMENYLDGDLPAALKRMDQAIARDDANHENIRLRGQWRQEAGDYEGALADFNRTLELSPQDTEIYIERNQVLQHLGRHREAIDHWSQMIQTAESQVSWLTRKLGAEDAIALHYNGRAYARAVAGIELDEGLNDVNQTIDRFGEDPALLDTRGYLYFRLGDLQEARSDLDAAVKGEEAVYARWLKASAKKQQQAVDLRKLDIEHRKRSYNLAVICYHRALVLEKLGRSEEAAHDLKRVKELGYEPNEHLF